MKKLLAIFFALSLGAQAQTLVRPLQGGTGVANANTMTTTRVGAFGLTQTLTGTTSITYPTSGTLATVAGTLPITGGTLTGNLLFTDNTYDIGASGATRPRDIFMSRTLTVGGQINGSNVATITVSSSSLAAVRGINTSTAAGAIGLLGSIPNDGAGAALVGQSVNSGTEGYLLALQSGNGSAITTNQLLVRTDGQITAAGLTTTGAASGKKVVCVDTATGILYASSTDIDCSN